LTSDARVETSSPLTQLLTHPEGGTVRPLRRYVIATFALIVTSACAHTAAPAKRATAPPTPTGKTATLRDTHEDLNAVLWMQTSAEYWVQTTTAYRMARTALQAAIKDPKWTAYPEQAPGYETLPPAVILDLDETVFDNSPSQGQQVIDRTVYTAAGWQEWVDKASATAVPGAKEFLAFAQQQNVTAYFITNRTLTQQALTLKNLEALGITASDDTVLCSGENGWTSDKSARRAFVATTHRVLMMVGDDLNDFVSVAKLTPAQRIGLAMTHNDRWGSQWILIVNPSYGTWERAITQDLVNPDDAAILAKKRATVKGSKQ